MSAYMSHTPTSHPWFASTSKRKRDFTDDSNADCRNLDGYSFGSLHPWMPSGGGGQTDYQTSTLARAVKRIKQMDGSAVESRRGEMEHGFASLSIVNDPASTEMLCVPTTPAPRKDSPLNGPSSISAAWNDADFEQRSHPLSAPRQVRPDLYPNGEGMWNGRTFVQDGNISSDETLVSSVRLPADEFDELPEVKMKSRTWFEPEKDRIVVMDLNSSDTESDMDPSSRHGSPRFLNLSNPDAKSPDFKVSPAFLSRLPSAMGQSNSLGLDFSMPINNPAQGSLVLYKSPRPIGLEELERPKSPELFAHIEPVDDEDVDMGSGCGTPMELDSMEFD